METAQAMASTPEHRRLEEPHRRGRVEGLGPLSERAPVGHGARGLQRGGDAWSYFSHEQARSRAYRWGEDGIAGVCDERQRLCLALALWNGTTHPQGGMFGLSNGEGNHGEDVKEYWYYLDSTPTHSYLKCQYKYPQRAFPYRELVSTNPSRQAGAGVRLLDTGIFDEDRYFDVIVEYAKGAAADIVMLVTAHNRGPDAATLHLLPKLWFRNTGRGATTSRSRRWRRTTGSRESPPCALPRSSGTGCARTSRRRCCSARTRRTTAPVRRPERVPVRQGCDQRVRRRGQARRSIERTGTKVAAHHVLDWPRGQRHGSGPLDRVDGHAGGNEMPSRPAAWFDKVLIARREEADQFYATVIPAACAAARRGDGDAPGAGGDAVGQAVLRVPRAGVAGEHGSTVGSERSRQFGAQLSGPTWSPVT